MLHNLVSGLTILGNGNSIVYLVAGSLIGMFLGVIPGLGGIVLLSVVIALINHISLTGTLSLFLAVQAGSFFSASITSILLNTPAHPEAFAVTFDGFPMAQRGEAGRALGISATSTCIGGIIGCICLVGFIPIINWVALIMKPPDYVALTALAMLLVGTLGTDSVNKGIVSAGLGLMISSVGPSAITGTYRYTFSSVGLSAGVDLVSLALGLFAIPQMILVFGTATTVARQDMQGNELQQLTPVSLEKGFGKQVIGGLVETLRYRWALLRASLIGVVTGIIPGIGAFAANFLSYGIAQQSSKHRENFGTGIPEGIIAPEGSSLSKEAGGLVPILGLGIPGGIGGALLLAALSLKGIRVGFGFAQAYPVLPYEMAWIIALGGIIGTAAGLLTAPLLAKVTRVPGPALVPFIVALSVLGPFIATVTFFAVCEVAVFTVMGLVLRRLRYSLASFVVGLVLGPTFENNVYLTHAAYHGVSFLKQPAPDILFAITLAMLMVKMRQQKKDRERAEAAIAAGAVPQYAYPVLAMIVTFAFFALATVFVIYGATQYSLQTAIMPVFGGSVVALGFAWRIPIDIRHYLAYRHAKQATVREAEFVPASTPALVGAGGGGVGDGEEFMPPTAVGTLPSNSRLTPIVEKKWGLHGQYTREVILIGWLLVNIFACYLFGFTVGTIIFVAGYGLSAMRRVFATWRSRIVFTVLSTAILGGITYEVVNVLHLPFVPKL